MRIYLTGFMGSGKTTIGKQLARRLNYVFEDLDHRIEKNYKTSIPLIFKKYDEPAFRRLEREALQKTVNTDKIVIATGGGTPCFFDNMNWMNEQGLTVYIRMHPKSLTTRILNAKKVRPLVRQKKPDDLLKFIETTMLEREPYYQQAAITVKGENFDMNKLVYEIIRYKNNTK